jgi:hypothetical protein
VVPQSRLAHAWPQQVVKGLSQLTRDRVLVIDHQPLKEGQVELAPEQAGCLSVGRRAVADSDHGLTQVHLGLLVVALDLGQAALQATPAAFLAPSFPLGIKP